MNFIKFIRFLVFFSILGQYSFVSGLPIDSIWNRFTTKYGNNFIVRWNERTNTPHKLYGEGIILKPSGFTKSSEVIEEVNSFMEENSYFFNINLKDLKIDRVDSLNADEWYITYKQYYHNLLVLGSKVAFTVNKNGKIVSMGVDYFPNINIPVEPKISLETAINIIERKIGTIAKSGVKKAILCIFPIVLENVIDYHIVWDFLITWQDRITDSQKSKRFLLDANTGETLRENDLIFHGNWTIDGHVMGVIRPEYRYDSPDCRLFPFEKLVITLDPGYYHIFYTNINGYFVDQGYTSQATNQLEIKLAGYFISEMWKKWFDAIPPWIHNAPIASHFYTFSSTGTHHYDYTWSADEGLQEEEAINAYWHITKIGKIIMDDPFWYYGAGYPIKVWVSEYDGESPYYNPTTEELWFTRYYGYHWALSSDCIYHEYGHHIIWNVYGKDFIGGANPNSQSRAMEEGFSGLFSLHHQRRCLIW